MSRARTLLRLPTGIALLLVVLISNLAAGVAVAAHSRFSDVPDDAYYAEAVKWVADEQITAGCAADKYCPEDPLSRGQMAVFLQRLGQRSINALGYDDMPERFTHNVWAKPGEAKTIELARVTITTPPGARYWIAADWVAGGNLNADQGGQCYWQEANSWYKVGTEVNGPKDDNGLLLPGEHTVTAYFRQGECRTEPTPTETMYIDPDTFVVTLQARLGPAR